MNTALFIDSDGNSLTAADITRILRLVGADSCETLFIHSDIMLGMPAPGVGRRQLTDSIYEAVTALGVRNIIVPAFTYSFCNGEDFDVVRSRTSMGAFSEYVRKLDGRYRTRDPLLSLSVPENLRGAFGSPGSNSLGKNSGLDTLHGMNDVKFLFFGARMGSCFTYLHYVEKMLGVPYRYDQEFRGNIIEEDGSKTPAMQYINTACLGVKPAEFHYFEDELHRKGLLAKERLGNSYAAAISEKDAYEQISRKLRENICYFLERPFTDADLVHKYTMGLDGSRVTHC